ncbi:MAG: MFS transporter [Pseudomonadota bacterium]
MTKNKKAIYGWAIYDWANSAFATTVMAGFFPLFFKQFWSAGVDVNLSTARLGLGNALAGLLVALLAPVLGAVADQGSARKQFLIGFAYLGVLMTAALPVVEKGRWEWAVAVYALGTIGFSGANVFYDALLPQVAAEKELDRVSSLGYALGYLGGGLLFFLNVMMTLKPAAFGLPDAVAAVRLSFLTVALWWGGFTVLTILWVPSIPAARRRAGQNLFSGGLNQLADTFREIRRLKTVWLFLLAYWCYIDGVDTIVRMAVDYGLSLGFGSEDLISALLIVQFVGFPAAIGFGKLGALWGERRAIFLAIGGYILITLWGAFMRHRGDFYVLAVLIGLVQGGIQALSRSYYARLIPPDRSAQFFGFYNMLGKFAVILGPVMMAGAGLLARRWLMPPAPTPEQLLAVSQLAARWSIGSVILLFVAGAVLFCFAGNSKKGG